MISFNSNSFNQSQVYQNQAQKQQQQPIKLNPSIYNSQQAYPYQDDHAANLNSFNYSGYPLPIAYPPSSFGSPCSDRDFNSPFIQSATSASSPLDHNEDYDYSFLSPRAQQQPQRDFQLFSPVMSPIIPQDDDDVDQLDGMDPHWLKNAPLFPDNQQRDPVEALQQPPQRPASTSHRSNQQSHLPQTVSPFEVALNSFSEDPQMNQLNPYHSSFNSGGGPTTLPPHLDSSPSPAPSHRGSVPSSRSSISMDGYQDEQNWNHQAVGGNGDGSHNSNRAVLDEISALASKFSYSHQSVDRLLQALNEKGITLEEGMISEILAAQGGKASGSVDQRVDQEQSLQSSTRPSRSSAYTMSETQVQDQDDELSSAPPSPDEESSMIDLNSEADSPESDHDDVYQPTNGRKRRSSSHASSSKPRKKPTSVVKPPILGESAQPTCPTCGTTFSRVFNLKTHMDTHIPPEQRSKPFICPNAGCRKGFSRKSDMKRHAKIHSRK